MTASSVANTTSDSPETALAIAAGATMNSPANSTNASSIDPAIYGWDDPVAKITIQRMP